MVTRLCLKLTQEDKRLGMELKWADITSGKSALAIALRPSVGRFDPVQKANRAKTEEGGKGTAAATKAVSGTRRPARDSRKKRAR